MIQLRFIFFVILFGPCCSYGGFHFEYSLFMFTDEEKIDNMVSEVSDHTFLLGATFGKGNNLIIGQNISQKAFSRNSDNQTNVIEHDYLELGPKGKIYNKDRTIGLGIAYNPYLQGTQSAGGVSYDITGSSISYDITALFKWTRSIFLGFNIVYYTASIEKKTVNNIAVDANEEITMLMPSINLNIRTR